MNDSIISHSESVITTTAFDWMISQLNDPAKLCRIYGAEEVLDVRGFRRNQIQGRTHRGGSVVKNVEFKGRNT